MWFHIGFSGWQNWLEVPTSASWSKKVQLINGVIFFFSLLQWMQSVVFLEDKMGRRWSGINEMGISQSCFLASNKICETTSQAL